MGVTFGNPPYRRVHSYARVHRRARTRQVAHVRVVARADARPTYRIRYFADIVIERRNVSPSSAWWRDARDDFGKTVEKPFSVIRFLPDHLARGPMMRRLATIALQRSLRSRCAHARDRDA